jgi:hypothetical protein
MHHEDDAARKQATLEALIAAYDRYLAPLREPGAGERLRDALRPPLDFSGMILIGNPDVTPPGLQTYIDEEMVKRGIEIINRVPPPGPLMGYEDPPEDEAPISPAGAAVIRILTIHFDLHLAELRAVQGESNNTADNSSSNREL